MPETEEIDQIREQLARLCPSFISFAAHYVIKRAAPNRDRSKPCIPGRKFRGKPIKHDKRRYKRRNRIENMFGRLKDWPIVGKTVPRTVF